MSEIRLCGYGACGKVAKKKGKLCGAHQWRRDHGKPMDAPIRPRRNTPPPIIRVGDYGVVALTRDKFALVDAADIPLVEGYGWQAHRGRAGNWYAGCRGQTRMHQVLLPGVTQVDHKNGDGLDNRRQNLRPATPSQNLANQRKTRGRSIYKGVAWFSRDGRWRAQIKVAGQYFHLGYFDIEEEAAKAYDRAAKELFHSFARTNGVA